ncbi:hypothetical protein [Glutamicibacter nicotianae]|uniref:hypothetical protein n=1 Tax=Glutamicibacter nicotianae TaxID=37929 RepID=UPI00195C0198|nr:hypothetical protein [Glutamicibacter nicotianae]MBM7768498.1 MFS family permease [Glutamicibacter nicotianae]
MATTRLFSVLVAGALLLAVGAALANPWPFLAGVLAVCGLLLLVAWPAFCIVVEIRTTRRRNRGLDISPRLTAAQRAIAAIQAVTMLILLPTIVLGGLAVYCLLTADEDPGQGMFKIAVGTGSLLLAAVPLLFFAHGRSPFMLRLAVVGVTLFGAGGLGAAALGDRDGGAGGGELVMLVAGLVMICAGAWLAVTGRNRWRRD